MIPIQLTLRNFLSYRSATLDFRGLETACVCGANGAGKSSLLEGMSWAIWGQSRVESEDDVIHQGQIEAQVEFIFQLHDSLYRIIRTRCRRQGMALEFQVSTEFDPKLSRSTQPLPKTFRPLTEKGIRATQQLIIHHVKLDYETFVNSAYLRQGRADEFMLKRPSDRKQILADLLKLNHYDELADRAKEQARHAKVQVDSLEQQKINRSAQLLDLPSLAAQQAELEATIGHLQRNQTLAQQQLQTLRTDQQQQQHWQSQLQWHQQQQQQQKQDCDRLTQEYHQAESHTQGLVFWICAVAATAS
jgi:DNA repair protein SbcC/Rad50